MMLAACRRSAISICNISKTASPFFVPAIRSSFFSLTSRNVAGRAIYARLLNSSSTPRSNGQAYARRQRWDDEPEHVQSGNVVDNEALYTKFQELTDSGLVNAAVIREITDGMGHHTMTPVQRMTITEALKGTDTVAQARTGTGKTLGFLVPVIQNILNTSPELISKPMRYERTKASDIRGIIMSPTRELAEQIAVEAKRLTRNTGIKVQVAVGGNSKRLMLRQMQAEGCHLLVATPGRLNDLLTDPLSRVSAPNLSTLVLDEADRLLDSGFRIEIEEIIRLLPDIREKDRQTLLFSATIPREVMGLVRSTLKPGFQFVQTIQDGEAPTHEKVPQKLVQVLGRENLMPALLELCKREIESYAQSPETTMPFKAIVYLTSTAEVELAGAIFKNLRSSENTSSSSRHPLLPVKISQMHGKLTQSRREYVSGDFRRAKSAILFSSDVTARGMDFPNVTHVIQVGLPPNSDQYIHRIGRTGRGDKTGEGWLIISELESQVAKSLRRKFPLVIDRSLQAATVDMTQDAQLQADLASTLSQVAAATKLVDRETKMLAYITGLTMNISNGTNVRDCLESFNQWTRYGWGWEAPPPIPSRLASKFGLSRLGGVNIQDSQQDADLDDRYGNERGAFGGGRGGRDRQWGGFGGGRGGQGGSSFGGGNRDGFRGRSSSGGGDRDGFRGRSGFEGGDRDGFRGRSTFGSGRERARY